MTVTFTMSPFPPSQQTIVYDLSYGFGPFDPGGDRSVSDVVAGHWPCSLTYFVSIQGLANRRVAAADVTVDHVVRHDDGICRVTVPWAPLFETSQARLLADVKQDVDNAIPDPFGAKLDYFVVMQPHFRSQGSNVQGGFLTEGLFNANVGPISGQVSINPAFNLGIRSDSLLQVDVLDRAVVATGFAEFAPSIKQNANTSIQCSAMNMENSVNSAFTQQVSQLFPNLAGAVNLTCSPPAPPPNGDCTTHATTQSSTQCFNTIAAGLTSIGRADLARALKPNNFVCDATSQCAFHPIIQAVNTLPNTLEFVLSPDLGNSNRDDLTPLYLQLPPSIIPPAIDIGGKAPVNIGFQCLPIPSGTNRGSITTTFSGNPDLASGLSCGAIANQQQPSPPPSITSLLFPPWGPPRGGASVDFHGQNFEPGQSWVLFGLTEANATCTDATKCTAISPPGNGSANVVVYNPTSSAKQRGRPQLDLQLPANDHRR